MRKQAQAAWLRHLRPIRPRLSTSTVDKIRAALEPLVSQLAHPTEKRNGREPTSE
jgi:hypothetical protein